MWGSFVEKAVFSLLPTLLIFPLHKVLTGLLVTGVTRQDGGSKTRYLLHRQSIPLPLPLDQHHPETELTIFSCSQAMHTCLVRIFETLLHTQY